MDDVSARTLLVKAHDWVRCIQNTRPTVVDGAGILVAGPGPETFFP